ncbi:MAG: hypothetical protein AB8F26_11785 [Phycisphaerales bacterium]
MHTLFQFCTSFLLLTTTGTFVNNVSAAPPNPHHAKAAFQPGSFSRAHATESFDPDYGIPCDAIGRTFRFDTGSSGYKVDVQVFGIDANSDGHVSGSSGFYSEPETGEIIDLRVSFTIDGVPSDFYINVESGEVLYPYFYFDWDLTTDMILAWDLGADPGTFFFAGTPVTTIGDISFYDSVRGVVGTIGDLLAADPGPTFSVENAANGICYNSISMAIAESVADDELYVSPGSYVGPIVWPAHDIKLIGSEGASQTVLYASAAYGEPIVHIGPEATRSSLLAGFELNGNLSNGGANYGSALVIEGSPSVSDCEVTNNLAGFSGGGIAIYGNPRLDRVRVTNNETNAEGGGIYIGWPSISKRAAGTAFRSDLRPLNNIGGAVKTELVNCLVGANFGNYGAGGVAVYRDTDITNCTIYSNSSFGEGAGVSIGGESDVNIANSVVWANESQYSGFGDDIVDLSALGTLTLRYNVFSGATGDNIDLDPMLTFSGTTVQVLPGSPVIDSGCRFLIPPDVIVDLNGAPRFRDDPGTADTGCGLVPAVDRGAVEF